MCRSKSNSRNHWIPSLYAVFLMLFISACGGGSEDSALVQSDNGNPTGFSKSDPGCLTCHEAIEKFHERVEIACTDCHGGDFTSSLRDVAHVQPSRPVINDATVKPLDYDLPYERFVNPSNLRVVKETCGNCHEPHVDTVMKSLMATTTGHHSGGLYLNGVDETKIPTFGTFATTDDDGEVPTEDGAVQSVIDLIDYDPEADQSEFATHYAAVPAQACARCHLWTRGKGYRGAEGKDGLYRADGCAACHMPYSNSGLSESADMSINHEEPGHPKTHRVTSAIPSEQCIHCHHRGARIGLSWQGKSQMPPGLPSGPGVPGTTDTRFNTNYHYSDDETNPKDIHGEAGMHCVDCHTQAGIMGDGNIYGHMDQATKIECRTCHGMPNETPTFIDKDGLMLNNIVIEEDGTAVLTSKVSGKKHIVPQVKKIVDPQSCEFNPLAAAAMNDHHLKEEGGLECYACHSSWMPNCFGCHFERDETKTGINLITREEVIGKASTNNKMFVSMKHFALGLNSQSKISPFIVGCHPIADVTAADGTKKLDFVMPKTKVKGLSGLAFNPANTHTTRSTGEVRKCIECHRSPPALGLGSGNYNLGRTHAYTLANDKLRVYERWANPENPSLTQTISLPADGKAIAVQANIVSGRADYVYIATGTAGVSVFDMQNGIPENSVATIGSANAIDVFYAAGLLFVTNLDAGINLYDVTIPTQPQLVSSIEVPMVKSAKLWGVHLFVAAGSNGLQVLDYSDLANPAVVGQVANINAEQVHLYAHFQKSNEYASRAYVADPTVGIHVIDLLPNFDSPRLVQTLPLLGVKAIDTYTRYKLADEDTPSREHDYLYAVAGSSGLHIFDIAAPDAIESIAQLELNGGIANDIDVFSHPAPPGVNDFAFIASDSRGLQVVNVNDPYQPVLIGPVEALSTSKVHVDVQQLDRFMDELGRELKENSHPGARPLNREELVKMLKADLSVNKK
ncbi:MAG: hypothetical protein KUG78_11955 [Kangiellaceae bacterium]|nr:hypothetical protein [Kangiellaceae bacterium]